MKKIIFTILVILIVSMSNSEAFSIRLPKHKNIKLYNNLELKSLARNAEKNNDYYTAIEFYEELYSRKKLLSLAFKLGSLHESLHEYQIAMDYYEKSINPQNENDKSLYFYAKMLKMNGDAINSLNWFKKFLRSYKGKDKRRFRLLTLSQIKGCKMIISKNSINKNIELTSLPKNINSNHIDYSPIPLNDSSFLFGSIRSDKKLITSVKRKLYISSKINNTWTLKEFNEIRPVYEDIVNATISPDGEILFITRLENSLTSKNVCKIYMLQKINGKWGNARLLSKAVNAPNSNNTQPSVGYDRRNNSMILYFASDRKNGFGGFDIWYATFDATKKKFSDARNLGNRINSVGDDITPFYCNKSNTLYFSSNGHPGLGGFDVFSSKGEKNYWRRVENIGEPINSSLDDLYYVLNTQMDQGYFVSNRIEVNGTIIPNCCDNLFTFINKNEIKIDIRGNIYASGNDSKDELLLNETKVELYEVTNDTKKLIEKTELKNNQYNFQTITPEKNYEIKIINKHFYNKEIYFKTPEVVHSEEMEIEHIALDALPKESITLENIYYEYDQFNLTKGTKNYLDTTLLKLLRENEGISIELSAHTDNIGTDEYNKILSNKRAVSVKNYLVTNGIDKSRISSIGYGEERPIADNGFAEGRKLNRRTEFKILANDLNYAQKN